MRSVVRIHPFLHIRADIVASMFVCIDLAVQVWLSAAGRVSCSSAAVFSSNISKQQGLNSNGDGDDGGNICRR